MHYYKRNIGDYYKKAGRLTMLQHGAYTMLIDACYDREKFPTEDEAIDWCWASTTDEILAVKFVLKRFFNLTDGVYLQPRIAEELSKFRVKSKQNREIALQREANKRSKVAQENAKVAQENSEKNAAKNAIKGDNSQKQHVSCYENYETYTNEHLTKNQEPLTNINTIPNGISDFSEEKPRLTLVKPKPQKNHVPYQQIIDLYHQTLPTLPRFIKLTKAREGQLSARWREDLPTLDDWREYFELVKKSPFLLGLTEPPPGRKPFKANLEWLSKVANYAKVIEGNYHGSKIKPIEVTNRSTKKEFFQ